MTRSPIRSQYAPVRECEEQLEHLVDNVFPAIPAEMISHLKRVQFTHSLNTDTPFFPCPFKQTECISVLKALESSIAAAIADHRFGSQPRSIEVALEKAARYLFSAYLCSVDGMLKVNPKVKTKLKDTDLKKAQSNIYRRFSTGLYATKRKDEFYHLHGSLDASTALNMIDLPAWNENLTTYEECISAVEAQMTKFTVEELEQLNQQNGQAGVKAFKREEFVTTEYGEEIQSNRLWECRNIDDGSSAAFWPHSTLQQGPQRILAGIKVLEMCRIIAGPSICRILAEYGADVLKITSPNLSDVPFSQVEGNMGKHAADLDLKSARGRAIFEQLLEDADVIVDGYRDGALERLGFGLEKCKEVARRRGKGIVYVSENCFGAGMYAQRPGWQQIADAVSGVAWEQGRFMGLKEPCIPPFPMSDYGTGCVGAIAAMIGLFERATKGGSYYAQVSFVQYDQLLFQIGKYSDDLLQQLRKKFAGPFFDLRHSDHTDVFSAAALATMKQVQPELFEHEEQYLERWFAEAYGAEVKIVSQTASITGIKTGYGRSTRPNGTDQPTWLSWETDRPIGA